MANIFKSPIDNNSLEGQPAIKQPGGKPDEDKQPAAQAQHGDQAHTPPGAQADGNKRNAKQDGTTEERQRDANPNTGERRDGEQDGDHTLYSGNAGGSNAS